MSVPKFEVGQQVRIGGVDKHRRMPFPYLRRGRIVKVKAIIENCDYLGLRHYGYVIQGRRGKDDCVLASYELRQVEEVERRRIK